MLAGSTVLYKHYGGPTLYRTIPRAYYKLFMNGCVTNSAVTENKNATHFLYEKNKQFGELNGRRVIRYAFVYRELFQLYLFMIILGNVC